MRRILLVSVLFGCGTPGHGGAVVIDSSVSEWSVRLRRSPVDEFGVACYWFRKEALSCVKVRTLPYENTR